MNKWPPRHSKPPEHDGKRVNVSEVEPHRKPRPPSELLAAILMIIQRRIEILEAKVKHEGSPDEETVRELVHLGRGLMALEQPSLVPVAKGQDAGEGEAKPDSLSEMTEEELTRKLRRGGR